MIKFVYLLSLLAFTISPVWSFKPPRFPKSEVASARLLPSKQVDETLVPSVKAAYDWYLLQCTNNPISTKSITAAIIASIGDLLSQKLESSKLAEKDFILDLSRTGSFFLCGLLYVGPFVHAWYELLMKLDRWLDKKFGTPRAKRVLTQVFVDQTLGIAIFFPAYFYVYEYLESLVRWRTPSLSDANAKCLEQISKVLLMQYRVMPLSNLINFGFVPKELRVLYSNTVSVFWNIYLCAIIG